MNSPQPTTSINVVFAIDSTVRALANMVLPYLLSLNKDETICIGDEFANVTSLQFSPARHRLFIHCNWIYDPSEEQNLPDALEDAEIEGWTVTRL